MFCYCVDYFVYVIVVLSQCEVKMLDEDFRGFQFDFFCCDCVIVVDFVFKEVDCIFY